MKFEVTFKKELIKDWAESYINIQLLKVATNRSHLVESKNLNQEIDKFDGILKNELHKVNDFYQEKVIELVDDIELMRNIDPMVDIETNHDLNFKHLSENCDKLRQFVLLNTIAVIKIVKRRNKRTPNIIDTKKKLEENEFYKCSQLKLSFRKLKAISNTAKLNYADNMIQNMSSFISFGSLLAIRGNCNVEDYNYLPHFDLKKIDDNTIKYYLDSKIGPNNCLDEIISTDNKLDITDIPKKKYKPLIATFFDIFIVIAFLYLFIFGLSLMGNSFKVLSGKGMSILSSINNPIAGVMIGIIATVLLQSSSTSTSIVVTMVGANIIDIQTAIPIIMGSNIGTSVTNTLISHAHIQNVDEFERAFAGATVHDMFNFLSVLLLLPIEVISQSLGWSLLFNSSSALTNFFLGSGAEGAEFNSPIKVIVSPFSNAFIKVNKDVIKASAVGCLTCQSINSTSNNNCWDIKMKNCLTQDVWNEKYENSQLIKSGLLKGLGDIGGGTLGLIISLIALCFSLYYIVKVLHHLVIQSEGKGTILKWVKKSVSISPYLTMLLGTILTISVQSSSIITSTFTPLVGLDIITVEQMFPLTLGANIGTTFTAILASLVTGSAKSIQIALCHLLFNIMGILIWYPVPFFRSMPLNMAIKLGTYVSKFKWFGGFYILYTFVFFPAICWGLSYLLLINIVGLVFGVILLLLFTCGSFLLFKKFDFFGNKVEKYLNRKKNTDNNTETNIELPENVLVI